MTKSKVYLSGRFIYRIVHEDHNGMYINHDNKRIPVSPNKYFPSDYAANPFIKQQK